MKLGIVGAGRVGLSIGKYFQAAGITLTGYYSRTLKSTEEGARFTGSSVFTSLTDILAASDTLLITTPDDEIASVWDCIVKECSGYSNKIVCHCSGSLSSEIFSESQKHGFSVCSLHPMYAFHHKYKSYQKLHQVFFTLEGDDTAVSSFCHVLDVLQNHYTVIDSKDKIKYHCAASMASNQVIALLSKSIKLLMQCGFSPSQAYEMLGPLAIDNVKNVFALSAQGVVSALTGPVERNDVVTVQKHLAVLAPEDKMLYQLLGKELVDIAKRKHPQHSYDELLNRLDEAVRHMGNASPVDVMADGIQ